MCWPAARDADQPLSMQGPWSRPHTTLLCLPQGAQTYSEKPGHRFALNQSWDAVKAEAYDALVIPGCPPRCGACSLTVVRLMQRRAHASAVCCATFPALLSVYAESIVPAACAQLATRVSTKRFRAGHCRGRAPEYLAAGSWPYSAPSAQRGSSQGPRALVPAPGCHGAGPGRALRQHRKLRVCLMQGPRARVPAPGRRGAGPGRAFCQQQADRGHLPRRAAACRSPGRAQGVRAAPAHAPCWRFWPVPVSETKHPPSDVRLTQHMTRHLPRCHFHAAQSGAAPALSNTWPFRQQVMRRIRPTVQALSKQLM